MTLLAKQMMIQLFHNQMEERASFVLNYWLIEWVFYQVK